MEELERSIMFAHLNHFTGEKEAEFFDQYGNLLSVYSHVRNVVAPYYDRFTTLLAKEKILIDARKSSDLTVQIVAADNKDDRLIVGIRRTIDGATKHFNPAVVDAAISLQKRLKPFGNIAQKSYEEEAAAIKILVADLLGEYAQKVELVGIMQWVRELDLAVRDFERLLQLRNTEKAAKPVERLREVRLEIENVYRLMINRIVAYDTIDDGTNFKAFIKELNLIISHYNADNPYQSQKDIKTAEIKPIPDQKETGLPITPLPEVTDGDILLVFTKDYTLSYKNNVNAGNAELTIHGKGAYKGTKTITFFIH